ncbi:MAG: hypothetical protein ABSA66_17425 [Roseiarcus sp.]|jgi:hypothetical protein
MKLLDFSAIRHIASTASGVSRHIILTSLGDFALVGAGVAMAVGSIAFAGYMLLQDNHEPRVNGLQYLAIFAKPRGPSPPTLAESPPVAAANRRVADDSLDMAPTGSIAHGAVGGSTGAEGYRIVAVEPGMAWLSNGSEIRVVKPGEVAPGLGRVASIVKRDGRWALVDESGATLLTNDKPETKGLDNGNGPFARRMIFGAGD